MENTYVKTEKLCSEIENNFDMFFEDADAELEDRIVVLNRQLRDLLGICEKNFDDIFIISSQDNNQFTLSTTTINGAILLKVLCNIDLKLDYQKECLYTKIPDSEIKKTILKLKKYLAI